MENPKLRVGGREPELQQGHHGSGGSPGGVWASPEEETPQHPGQLLWALPPSKSVMAQSLTVPSLWIPAGFAPGSTGALSLIFSQSISGLAVHEVI